MVLDEAARGANDSQMGPSRVPQEDSAAAIGAAISERPATQ
jgi:hypothetical protein